MADEAIRMAKYGAMREQHVGRFDKTTWSNQFLYTVDPIGDLVWQADLIVEDRNAPLPPAPGLSDRVNATKQNGTLDITPPATTAPYGSGQSTSASANLVETDAVNNTGRLSQTNVHLDVPSPKHPRNDKWMTLEHVVNLTA